MARRATLVREAPELFTTEQDLAKRLVDLARVMKDWEKMLLAIDFQIAQQAQFVAWWGETVRRKGGERWIDNAVRGYQSMPRAEAEKRTGISQQQVSRWRGLLAEDQIEAYRQKLRDESYRAAGLLSKSSHRTLGTGDNEWFTPPVYIESARRVLGEIDLDPATHPKAQKWIKAKKIFVRADDGLQQAWEGRVWLNPPYGRMEVGQFVDKLVDHYQRGDIRAAILLTHNYTDTRWFQAAAAISSMICFTRGRISFEDVRGDTCVPTQGQSFFYFGTEGERFIEEFLPLGFVVGAVSK